MPAWGISMSFYNMGGSSTEDMSGGVMLQKLPGGKEKLQIQLGFTYQAMSNFS